METNWEDRYRADYVRAVCGALRETGSLLAIFYMDPGNRDDGPPYGVSKSELDLLFHRYFELQKEWIPTVSYPGREGRELVRLLRKRGLDTDR